ncbi:MAG: hypothetical protein ABJK28_06445 [Algibacter sp.]
MKKILCCILIAVVCFSFSSDLQKKVIRNNGFDIECYVSPKKQTNFNDSKVYYWYKSGEIHQSLSNAGGFVLHKDYYKYYKSNELAEQGTFNFGLKIGTWKTWYKNGSLKIWEEWKQGHRDGHFKTFDSLGNLVNKGVYKNNIKNGYWVNYVMKDTVYHKSKETFKERPKNAVERLLRKRDSLEKIKIKFDRITKRKTDSIKRIKVKSDRLIKKRNDSINKVHNKLEKVTQKKLDSINKSKGIHENFFKKLFKKEK